MGKKLDDSILNGQDPSFLMTRLNDLTFEELGDLACLGVSCVNHNYTYRECAILNDLLHSYDLSQIRRTSSKALYAQLEEAYLLNEV